MQQMQQMQASGNNNPQIMQHLMGQMQAIQQQIQNGGVAQIGTNKGEMGYGQQMNPNVDYSFTAGGEDMGNDFNAAFAGGAGPGGYSGFDSLDQSFKAPEPNGGGGNMGNIPRPYMQPPPPQHMMMQSGYMGPPGMMGGGPWMPPPMPPSSGQYAGYR